MKEKLYKIREREKTVSGQQQVLYAVGFCVFGIVLGVLSKYLDCTAANELPYIIEQLDVGNFLSRFAIWVFLAVWISVKSDSPIRAAGNVFVFFLGMVSSYYLYTHFIAGFFPKTYALIWFAITAISPVLAYICWFAKGKSKISLVLSAFILGVMVKFTFAYGWLYVEPISLLEFVVFIGSVFLLKRKTKKENNVMFFISVATAVVMNYFIMF